VDHLLPLILGVPEGGRKKKDRKGKGERGGGTKG